MHDFFQGLICAESSRNRIQHLPRWYTTYLTASGTSCGCIQMCKKHFSPLIEYDQHERGSGGIGTHIM